MSYAKINWTDTASTPLCADNLNQMDNGIYNANELAEENENTISLHDYRLAVVEKLSKNNNTLLLYPNQSSNIIKNSKNFTALTDIEVLNGTVTVTDGTLQQTQPNDVGLYARTSKDIQLTSDGLKTMLLKVRLKATATATIAPAWRWNANGTFIAQNAIIGSNLSTLGAIKCSWQTDLVNTYTDFWLIAKPPVNATYNDFGFFVTSTGTVNISHIQAFYSAD